MVCGCHCGWVGEFHIDWFFLMDPLCGILLSGNLGSVLCILSWILGHLCVVVVGIKWALGFCGSIGIMWLHKCGSRMFTFFGSGMDDEEGIAIITLLGPDSLQWWYPCFYLLWIFACKRWIYIHRHIIVQLRWDWSGGWEIFLHALLGLIIVLVGSGLGVWMPLWMGWGVSYWLGFLMDPLCGILLSGNLGSVLCILSWILGHLCVVVVGIKYY